MLVGNEIRSILLLILLALAVDSLDVGGHDFLTTTFAYRKKPNTAVTRKCMMPHDLVCNQQDQYCAAFHVGKNFFATAAHCLVGIDGFIQDPDELEIIGVGKVNVSIVLHHNFANMTGVDVAWIHYQQPQQLPTVRVAKKDPIVCYTFRLDVFDPAANGIHAGHRWIETPNLKRIFSTKDPVTGKQYQIQNPYAVYLEQPDTPIVERVILCTAQDSKEEYEVHYITVGFVETALITVDCHNANVRCGYTGPENMMHPVTTTKPITKPTTRPTTKPTTKPPKKPTKEPATKPTSTTSKLPTLAIPMVDEDLDSADVPSPVMSTTRAADLQAQNQITKPTPRYKYGTLPLRSYSSFPLSSRGDSRWIGGKPQWEAGNPSYVASSLSHRGNALGIDGRINWTTGNLSMSAGPLDWNNWNANDHSWNEKNILEVGKMLDGYAESVGSSEIGNNSSTTKNEPSQTFEEVPSNSVGTQNVTYFNQVSKMSVENKTTKSTTEKLDVISVSPTRPDYSKSEQDDWNFEEQSYEELPPHISDETEIIDNISYDQPTSASDGEFPIASLQWSEEDYKLLEVPITAATTRRKCRKPTPTLRTYKLPGTEKAKIKINSTIPTQDVAPKPTVKITMRNADSSAVTIDEVSTLLQTFLSVILVFILTC